MSILINDVKCDLYIGTGAGEMLQNDIAQAKESIVIVSPYLSPGIIKDIIAIHHKGLKIHLITSDDIEDFNHADKNIYNLIIQNRITDEEKLKKRKFLMGFVWLFLMLAIVFSLVLIRQITLHKLSIQYIGEGGAVIALLLIFVMFAWQKIKKMQIYFYTYEQLFPFDAFISPYKKNKDEKSKFFIHSKIYVIDNKIAYLGSLNLTSSGFDKNHETRVKIEDEFAISKILEEIENLYQNDKLIMRDIQEWGREIYSEPIN